MAHLPLRLPGVRAVVLETILNVPLIGYNSDQVDD